MTRPRGFSLVVALVVTLVLSGACGGGGGDGSGDATATFDDDRFGITFEYPADFDAGDITEVQASSGGTSTADRALGIDDANAIFISRYELEAEVSEDNVDDVRAELDGVVSDLVGAEITGRRTDVGGFVAFRYDNVPVPDPEDAESDIVMVFDGSTQYQVNCQSTPAHRSRIDDACERAIATLAAA